MTGVYTLTVQRGAEVLATMLCAACATGALQIQLLVGCVCAAYACMVLCFVCQPGASCRDGILYTGWKDELASAGLATSQKETMEALT